MAEESNTRSPEEREAYYGWKKGETNLSQCAFCKHKQSKVTEDDFRPTCTAYPAGIPGRFLSNAEKHDTPQQDQVGEDTFEPRAEDPFETGKSRITGE